MPLETVKLKNGAEEEKTLVAACMLNLQGLLKQDPISFYDLAMHCRDRSYEINERSQKELRGRGLLSPTTGVLHESVKNIILSAVVEDGLDMKLVPPLFS